MNAPDRSIERELKLAVPPGFRLPTLTSLDGLAAQAPKTTRFRTDFYDTGDLALAAWGVVLRFRGGEGWTVKLPDRGDLLAERQELTFAGSSGEVPPRAVEILAAYLRGRPVAVRARTATVRRRTPFADTRGSERIALVDDRVTTLEPDARRAFRQLEVELIDPDAGDLLDELSARLEDAGATAGDDRSKYGWALGDRAPVPEVVVPELAPDAMLRDVVRAALGSAVADLVHADAAIREGGDPEGVHRARVATRRLRSHLRTFRGVLEPAWADGLRAELTALGDTLGRVRDTEVLSDRLSAAAARVHAPEAVERIVAILAERLAAERDTLAAMMTEAHYFALLDRALRGAATPPLRADGEAPAVDTLGPAVRRTWRGLRKRVRRAGDPPADAELHAIRIAAKRARYASETVAPLSGKRAAAFSRAAARLQSVLGEHQDAVVAWNWLRDAAREGRIDTFTAGELAALQLAAQDAARGRWPKTWKAARRRRPSTW